MKNLIMICLFSVFFISFAVRAEVVDFECVVREYGDKYNLFLEKIAKDPSDRAKEWREIYKKKNWWEVWSGRTLKLIFSIEEQTYEVVYPPSTTMSLKAKILTLKEYYDGQCGDKKDCQRLSAEYEINLATGQITGTQYAADNSWEPYFKQGEQMWFTKGKCQIVKDPLKAQPATNNFSEPSEDQ